MISTTKEIYREMRAKKWLAVALAAEALGLIAAIGSIPAVGFLPLIWTLATVGILSTVGILIVTGHYVWEYNRRPMNNTQKEEVEKLLAPYLLSETAKNLATREELSEFVREDKLFWRYRYQESIMELAWTADSSLRQPGYVLVADLFGGEPLNQKVVFTLLPPPVQNPGECLSLLGKDPPQQYIEWGTLFDEFSGPVVFFQNNDGRIKYLRADQKVVFDDRLAAPIPAPVTKTPNLPELRRTNKAVKTHPGECPYEWTWETPQSPFQPEQAAGGTYPPLPASPRIP